MKVLFTGLDPFGGATINPAYEAIKLLPEHFGTAARDAVLGCIYDQYLHFSSFIYFIYVELYR